MICVRAFFREAVSYTHLSDKEDPQHTGDNAGSMSVTTDEGASADETQILSASTVAEDVYKRQGKTS